MMPRHDSQKDLLVSLPGKQVGELTQNRSGKVTWRPDTQWVDQGQQPRMGLSFLRNSGTISHASELPAWFENLLPERGSPLRSRLCTRFGLRDGQSFALLRAVGDDVIGAVTFHPLTTLDSSNGAAVDDETRPLTAERLSSLTGMQLKLSMSMINERLVMGMRGGNSEWIVKFPGREHPELPEVELCTMQWAKAAGFSVPAVKVVRVSELEELPADWTDATNAFAIERFDRRRDGTRIHQEDFCQALGIHSAKKYGNQVDALVSYDGAMKLVLDVCGDDEWREMARRIGFMIASGNDDAHLKNWSLIWGDRISPVLTPNYDLVSTISWPAKYGWDLKGGPQMALKLGGEKYFRNVGQDCIDAIAKSVGRPAVKAEILDAVASAKQQWRTICQQAPTRMVQAVAQHMQNVPLLR